MSFEVRIDLPEPQIEHVFRMFIKSRNLQSPFWLALLAPWLTLRDGGRFDSLRGLRPRATAPKMPPPIVVNKMPEPASTMAVSVEDLVSYVPLLPFRTCQASLRGFDRFLLTEKRFFCLQARVLSCCFRSVLLTE